MQILVFSSNLLGIHKGEIPEKAMKYGAIYYNPKGFQGKTYAIPSFDRTFNRLSLDEIKKNINEFLDFALLHHRLTYFVTNIGGGDRGYPAKLIAPFFRDAVNRSNIYLPESFYNHL